MPLPGLALRVIQCQRLNRPPKKSSIRSTTLVVRGNSTLPVNSAYIPRAVTTLVSPRLTVILLSGGRSGRSGSLPMNSAWFVSDAAAALAALVVSGPKGETHVTSLGAFSGRALGGGATDTLHCSPRKGAQRCDVG